MGTIAHVLEAAGIATVALSLVRGQAESTAPPRVLHCDFPLGRPLGRPKDPAFQRRVIKAALALLDEPSGPVIRDFPESIEDASDRPLACPLPPRERPDLHPAADEALGLRRAWERSRAANGRTLVGRAVGPEGIPEALVAFAKVADGTPWKEAGLPGHPLQVSRDITSYYEEAAAALVDHVPEARAAETWLYQQTEAGKVLKAARRTMKEAGEPFWFYVIPFTQDL